MGEFGHLWENLDSSVFLKINCKFEKTTRGTINECHILFK